MYALGLARLAAVGDLVAIAELADVIALSAQAYAAERRAARARRLGRGRGRDRVGPDAATDAAKSLARERRSWRRRRAARRGRRSRRLTHPCNERHSDVAVGALAGRRGSLDFPPRGTRPQTGRKPKTTAEAQIPGAFEGETVTRRRFMTGTAHAAGGIAAAAFTLPAVGLAVAPVFEKKEVTWEAVGPVEDFVDDTYIPRTLTLVRGIGDVGKSTVYIRRYNAQLDSEERDEYNAVHRDLDALHAPRLPGALRRRVAEASSARATAASTTSRARSPAARRSARWIASTRACATARSRSARASA